MSKDAERTSKDPRPAKERGIVTYKGLWKPDDPRYKQRFSAGTGGLMGPATAASRQEEARPPAVRLVLSEHPANGGLVVATEERARFVDQIRKALDSSRTWGELKAALPAGEYSPLAEAFAELEGKRPRLDQPFDPEEVAGVSEGDYPPWLQAEMDAVVPEDVLSKFGHVESTMMSGSYVHIDPARRADLVRELEHRGFVVIEASNLSFY